MELSRNLIISFNKIGFEKYGSCHYKNSRNDKPHRLQTYEKSSAQVMLKKKIAFSDYNPVGDLFVRQTLLQFKDHIFISAGSCNFNEYT